VSLRRIKISVCVFIAGLLMENSLAASEHRGEVTLAGLPVPGATVTARQDGKEFSTVTNAQGLYAFPDLTDGVWTVEIEMLGFSIIKREIGVAPDAPSARWEVTLLPVDQIDALIAPPQAVAKLSERPQAQSKERAQAPGSSEELDQLNPDGLLINGSVNNGAASPVAQSSAFGSNRRGARKLYTGGVGLRFDNSFLDATPFSLAGQNTPKPSYNDVTGMATLGGPLRIPHILENGPSFFVTYQWTRNRIATTQPALMPDSAERNGVFPKPVVDPLTGMPFPGNTIPQSRISPQAQSLLNFYPTPNFTGSSRYNYQIPLVSPTHQDALQSRVNQALSNKDQISGAFAFQDARIDRPNIFGFLDTTDTLGINASVHGSHRFGRRLLLNLGFEFNRLSTRVTPYFENRENVSGNAGILGNSQDPVNWGPPGLNFSSGIAGLNDSLPAFNRNQTSSESGSMSWNRGTHNITFGGDFRRQEFNYLSQQDPRGTFTFTGAGSGSDFADFLLGNPVTSSVAFGNADKYFRESLYDAYFTDDWRMGPSLTLNAGVRWEYSAPITELYNRLVNLDIAPGFTAVAPVRAGNAVGSWTRQRYPDSLLRPDRTGFEPRVGIAWRPISGSSVVVRAGYGVYYNTSAYQAITAQLAQQPPLSKTLSVQNTPANPFTLADGFNASPSSAANTFAIDPNFRVGYAQNWQISLQSDLPGSLQLTATYLGIKGTRGLQEFLPNTYPIGAANPCLTCPAGYVYLASNGNSTHEAGIIQLRRRLHNGFTATLQYVLSKSIDDAATLGGRGAVTPMQTFTAAGGSGAATALGTGSAGVAQNWLDLSAERSLSSFDQRHLLTLQAQYTTGMGLGGGTLLSGWKGSLFKEWSVATSITAGSGLPQTPVYLAVVPGTGMTGTIRPFYTGAPLYSAPSGLSLNPAAFAPPPPGQWGNAGRDSITGPAQFTLNASLGRVFRLKDRVNLDVRADATNALNHVTFTGWNTTINNAQFGLPVAANAMRSVQLTLRLRF
jgi:hypothetical protein